MKPSAKRSLSLLLTAVLLIGALIFYTNILKPEYNRIQTLRGELAAKKVLFDDRKVIIDRVKDLLTNYQSAMKLQKDISLALPFTADTAPLFNQIFSHGRNSGLQLQSLGFNQIPPNQDGLGVVQMTLNLRGSYPSLKTFLQLVETNTRVMDVSRLTITGDTYNLTINAYYQ